MRRLLPALALVAALARGAGAWGFRAGESGAGLRLGPSYPTATNSFDVATRAGFSGALQYFRSPADFFIYGVELDVFGFRYGKSPILPGETPGSRLSGTSIAALGTARFNLIFDQPYTIYVLGGAGIHDTMAKVETLAGTVKGKRTGLSVAAGAGAEVFTLKDTSLFFEARWQELRLPKKTFGVDAAEFLAFHAGMNFRFGIR